ncbi:hypothetical protein [Marilutibacter maris]|uniref:hypothetical protein n=1 Tax=Marilutibacter maris TaxID=1605891 RepID=UPI000DA9F099|nr:hypothetical protein [Lysobacter maris]
MKNDLLPAAISTGRDDLSEQLVFEFSDEHDTAPRARPAANGYFLETIQLLTGNGLPYVLRVWQDCRTGEILSYRLLRATTTPTPTDISQ